MLINMISAGHHATNVVTGAIDNFKCCPWETFAHRRADLSDVTGVKNHLNCANAIAPKRHATNDDATTLDSSKRQVRKMLTIEHHRNVIPLFTPARAIVLATQ